MTSEQFYEILGHIDEQYLEEARQPSKMQENCLAQMDGSSGLPVSADSSLLYVFSYS